MNADEIRAKAAACRLMARIAMTPASEQRLLKAAERLDRLAKVADASRVRKPKARPRSKKTGER
jgi:hypothetical protein